MLPRQARDTNVGKVETKGDFLQAASLSSSGAKPLLVLKFPYEHEFP